MSTAVRGQSIRTPLFSRMRNILRRRQVSGALLTMAVLASVVVIGTDPAVAQFGSTPPPASSTLCETDRPAEVDYDATTNAALNWPGKVPVTVDVNSVDGDSGSATLGAVTPYAGDFTYAVTLDNTGDPFDPDVNNHPSYHPIAGNSPVVLTGGGTGSSLSIDLPPGCRYIMSVRAAGHDLGGSWIRIESDGTYTAGPVNMLTSDALPLAQVVVRAFHDYAQVNAQFDQGEPGLEGFDVQLYDGGELSTDYFENPLCTNYVISGGTDPNALDPGDFVNGAPVIDPVDPGGNCLTDANGFVVIKYLTAGWYETHTIPPDGTDWIQTTTIEGTHIVEAWIMPGDDGLGGEFVGDIGAGTFQAVGFVSPTLHPDATLTYHYPYTPDPTGGDITGCAVNGLLYPSSQGVRTIPQDGVANADGTRESLRNAYVALNDVGNHDSQMDIATTDDNGCFRFVDVPVGSYQLAIWDYDLRYIIGFYSVTVDATTLAADAADQGAQNGQVDMGSIFVLRWFGMSSGYVFYDSGYTADGRFIDYTDPNNKKDQSTQAAANGVRDCLGQGAPGFVYDAAPLADCEAGIPGQDVLIRGRDGSIAKATVTDANGRYEFDTIWSPLFRMQVIEVGAGSLDITGHSVHDHFDRNQVATQGNCPADVSLRLEDPATYGEVPQDCLPAELGGALLLASIFQQGKRTEIDFGKISYLDPNAPNNIFTGTGNGGIAGSVANTVTRAAWSAAHQAIDPNEAGIPGVEVTLYGLDPTCADADPVTGLTGADNPDCYRTELDSLVTDTYQHPGKDRNGQACPIATFDGTSFAAVNPTFGPIGDNCVGSWLLGPHTKDGAWNGGFAFTGLDAGTYVVQVTPPPGYQIVKENDLNTGEGNAYVPAAPPPACVGEYHYAQLDSGYASPYDAFSDPDGSGTYNGTAPVRLCDRRLVRVQPLRNAGVDISLMTTGMDRTWTSNFGGTYDKVDPYSIPNQVWSSSEAVPPPSRFYGLVLDDLTMTANQNALSFGEQQGVSNIPIGVYDYTGTLITTVWTDENGQYELLLPSTFSINRPSPSGIGPQMYNLVINDPGPTNDNWGYDPSYITNPNTLDAWPGTMTKADTPVLSLASAPCSLPVGTPQLLQVNAVYGDTGSLPTDYTIDGLNLTGATVTFSPVTTGGTVDEAAAIDATPYATVSTLPTPDDPGSFYDEMVIDLAAMEAAEGPMAGPYDVHLSDGTRLGDSPRNGITFHVLTPGDPTYDLEVHTVPAPVNADDKVIQATIDAAVAGADPRPDLIVVPPRTYRESLVVHAGMVLQGFGPGGIIGVGTEAGPIGFVETPYASFTGSVISPFGALLDDRMFLPWESTVSSITWGGNQGVEVGSAFQVLLDAGEVTVDDPFQIDGFGITSVRAQNGAVHVNGNADGLLISNNGIQANNASAGGAAINLGTPSAETFVASAGGDFDRINGRVVPVAPGTGSLSRITGRSDANNDGVVIRDNRLLRNGGVAAAGALGIFNGNDGYRVLDNDICGNYAAEYGGGISHSGVSNGGVIRGNAITNNKAFDEGGGIMIAGEFGYTGAGDLGQGIGSVTIDGNELLYNLSNDDGGAIMVLHPLESPLRIVNNIIGQNVATDLGGGIHLFDASEAVIGHNTISHNLSANAAPDSGGFACNGDVRVGTGGTNTCPRAGGLTTQAHSAGFTPADGSTFSDPVLQNNIFWANEAGVVDANPPAAGNIMRVFGISDMGVYDGATDLSGTMDLNPEYSLLSVPYGASTTNLDGVDPQFVLEGLLETKSVPSPQFGQPAEITMVFPGGSSLAASDYHLAGNGSLAVDFGTLDVDAFDFDGDPRPTTAVPITGNAAPDAGADELGGAGPRERMYFSTTRDFDANLGIQDVDVQGWGSAGIATVLSGAAGTGAAADIDAVHRVTETLWYVSFIGAPVTLPAGPGGASGTFTVEDEDIVSYDATTDTWALAVDGSAFGLIYGARDIDALHRLPDGSFLVSFTGLAAVPSQSGTIGVPDEDIVRLVPVTTTAGVVTDAYFEPWFSGTSLGLNASASGDIDGFAIVGSTLLFSTRGPVPSPEGTVYDEDVQACTGLTQGLDGLWTCTLSEVLYFDGSVEGLASNNDVNAVSGPVAG